MSATASYKNPAHPVLQSAQRKLFWDERANPPKVGSARFLLRVMDIGTWQMVRAMEKSYPREYLAEVVQHASCGALSPKSWNFWCIRLGLDLPYPQRFS